jgi:hypothetical protein
MHEEDWRWSTLVALGHRFVYPETPLTSTRYTRPCSSSCPILTESNGDRWNWLYDLGSCRRLLRYINFSYNTIIKRPWIFSLWLILLENVKNASHSVKKLCYQSPKNIFYSSFTRTKHKSRNSVYWGELHMKYILYSNMRRTSIQFLTFEKSRCASNRTSLHLCFFP